MRWPAALVIVAGCGGAPGGGGGDAAAAIDAEIDAPAFALRATVTRAGTGPLTLATNLPARATACAALPEVGAPCADVDGDGLTDAWEDLALDRLRPLLRFDEDEQLIGDAGAVLRELGRVTPRPGAALDVVAIIVLAYALDYGSCGGFTGHHGDSERVALRLGTPAGGGPGDVEVVAAFTTGHEGTSNDQSRVFAGADRAQLVTAPDPERGEPRWVVYPSADKHATYATVALCEGVSVVPCFDEDCGPDGVADPAAYDRLPPAANVGEPGHRRVDDLAALGFPGDSAWGAGDFCGGLGGTSCSSGLLGKFTDDPFGP
jgi:hypothetical protein